MTRASAVGIQVLGTATHDPNQLRKTDPPRRIEGQLYYVGSLRVYQHPVHNEFVELEFGDKRITVLKHDLQELVKTACGDDSAL